MISICACKRLRVEANVLNPGRSPEGTPDQVMNLHFAPEALDNVVEVLANSPLLAASSALLSGTSGRRLRLDFIRGFLRGPL